MTYLRLVVVLVWFTPAVVHAEATASLKAVAKNGIPIAPTNSLSVVPGDIITAEIYISGWSDPPLDGGTGELHLYQASLDPKSDESGSCGTILPVALGHPSEKPASIDIDRNDFVFHSNKVLCAVDVSSLRIRWGCVQFYGGQIAGRCQEGQEQGVPCSTKAQCPSGFCNDSFPHYAGTLNLQVGPDACGIFEFSFLAGAGYTFFGDESIRSTLPALEKLSLTSINQCPVGACCIEAAQPECYDNVCPQRCSGPGRRFGGVGSSCDNMEPPCFHQAEFHDTQPKHCTIDARIPFLHTQPTQRQGITSLTWLFQDDPSSTEDEASDFEITQIPDAPPFDPPVISTVRWGNHFIILDFDRPVQPNRWTCIRHVASNTRRCVGFLPGDANGNRTAAPNDILDIIDNLNSVRVPPLQLYQCDIDRSDACDPKDILTEIDLLNGTNGFPIQNGRTLPPCPSAP